MTKLVATKREKLGKANKALRKAGTLPAVMYGYKTESTSIAIDAKAFDKVWKAAGESTMITIETPDGEKDTLIHDVDSHPVTGVIRHIDFLVVDSSKPVEIKIPLKFIGLAPAVKNLGGILVKVLHELEISVLPKNIPHEIVVDTEVLADLDSQIKASDLVMPAGATLITLPDEIVASIAIPKEEEVESVPIDLSAIEVEKKGKVETAEEGTGAPKE